MHTDQRPDDDGPVPGESRDPGPRPNATPRDLAWASLAVIVGGATLLQLIGLVLAVSRPGLDPGGGGLFLAFLVTVVWLLTIYWLVMGAWRRSVWGCPFPHHGALGDGRRCPRHGSIPDPHDLPHPRDGSVGRDEPRS